MKTASFFVLDHNPGAVSIARSAPVWFKGPVYKPLAPPWSLVKDYKDGGITWEQYVDAYDTLVLLALDPRKVYDEILDLVPPGAEPVLCCWEMDGLPCHRHLVAAWFNKNLPGVTVKEVS